MDWSAEFIERHREALKGILAGLVAMVGLGQSAIGGRPSNAPDCPSPPAGCRIPRHLHRAVLRLLRPAESAARRLAIALAQGLSLPPARIRSAPPDPLAALMVRDRIGTGVVWTAGRQVPPARPAPPKKTAPRRLALPLLDPLPRWRRTPYRRATGVPRILLIDAGAQTEIPAWRPPLADDPLDARRLTLRLDALGRALDDLPGLARRYRRWQARRDAARAAGRHHRVTPLRPGRPPGGRLSRYDPDAWSRRRTREVDRILAHAQALAWQALSPDTS